MPDTDYYPEMWVIVIKAANGKIVQHTITQEGYDKIDIDNIYYLN